MKLAIPPQLRQMLDRPINELCARADDAYRKTSRRDGMQVSGQVDGGDQVVAQIPSQREPAVGGILGTVGLALRAAAMQAGEYAAWQRIAGALRNQSPDIARLIDLDP